MSHIRKLIWIVFFFIISLSTYSADKNPRVYEVESMIKENVSDYIRNVLPNTHFLVNVNITPLRRNGENYQQKGEVLPYFEMSQEEVRDEWDDPTISIYSLMRRIQTSDIKILFTSNPNLKSQSEFVSDLIAFTGLVPGRDRVSVDIKNIVNQQESGWSFERNDIRYLAVVLLLLIGLGVIAKLTYNKSVEANIKQGTRDVHTDLPTRPSKIPVHAKRIQERSHDHGLSRDVSLTDPTKTIEVIRDKIDIVVGSGTFPSLNDMIELEKLAYNSPSSFSFLVFEFSITHQNEIFKYGRGERWYECFSGVGQVDRIALNSLEKILRNRNIKSTEPFEKLLIQSWRLEEKLPTFLQEIDPEYAYSILYHLPKNISIPIGRKIFAGSWGKLVTHSQVSPIENLDVITNLLDRTYELKPLLSSSSLELYKSSIDLLKYLNEADVKEEEDIYSVLGEESDIPLLRPPYYTFFKLPFVQRDIIFRKFTLEEWALSIFDTDRNYRKIIDEHLDDKKMFLLSTMLKNLDQEPPRLEDRGIIREKIGKYISLETHLSKGTYTEDILASELTDV